MAQAAAPEARIVYADNDPIVLSHAHALCSSTPEGVCDYVAADLRDTSSILRAASATLDLGKPVALMLLIILHLISDEDDPYDIVATLVRALPAGSYLVLAHPASDIRAPQMAAGLLACDLQAGFGQIIRLHPAHGPIRSIQPNNIQSRSAYARPEDNCGYADSSSI